METPIIAVRIESKDRKLIQKAANDCNRKLSEYIRLIAIKAAKAKEKV